MKRFVISMLGSSALTLSLASPAGATVRWVCTVPEEGDVTFVSAPDAAAHGIETANSHAGQTFAARFGEECTVRP